MRLVKSNIKHDKEKVLVVEDDETDYLPVTKVTCPKCGNGEAHWFMKQMRAGDEPPTLFFTCTKCKYKWRSYG